jgi:hypothetical protein
MADGLRMRAQIIQDDSGTSTIRVGTREQHAASGSRRTGAKGCEGCEGRVRGGQDGTESVDEKEGDPASGSRLGDLVEMISRGQPVFKVALEEALEEALFPKTGTVDAAHRTAAMSFLLDRHTHTPAQPSRARDEGQNVGEKKKKRLKSKHSGPCGASGPCVDVCETWDHATFRVWIKDHPVFTALLPGLPWHVTPAMLNGEVVAKYWIESWVDLKLRSLAAACANVLQVKKDF